MKNNKKNFFRFMSLDNQQKNWFDLSHTNSGSCNMGYLVPVLCEPTLPDDYFSCELSYLIRMAQMVAPPMTRIGVSFFAFDVPNRILMDSRKWDKWLADVDNTSGVSLPVLSFSPIYSYMKEYLSNWLLERVDTYNELPFIFDRINNSDYINAFREKYEFDKSFQIIFTFDFNINRIVVSNTDSQDVWNNTISYNGDELSLLDYVFETVKSLCPFPMIGTLMDYLGFPVNSPLFSTSQFLETSQSDNLLFINIVDVLSSQRSFQVLPMLAYLFIWNEYFRQEFIQEEIPDDLLEDFNSWKEKLTSDISILWRLKRRDWEHDYFTSCLPAPQLGESASIEIGQDGHFTIPELREANVIQKIREKLLHGGSRVWEILANFFGSDVSDARIQIPQYIRPDKRYPGFSWLRISDIYQTAPGTSDSFPTLSADSNIAAPRGASVNTNRVGLKFQHKCKEHGYIIVLMNIQPEPVYCQGIPRHFLSLDTLDMGWPDFANITEQPVYNYEVYATNQNVRLLPPNNDYPIFGFQSQYAWYKFHNSELHGELRNDLDFFHFGRVFESQPELNSKFLECNPTDRPFPIQYEYDKITYHIAFNMGVDRKLPYYGVPSLR